MIGSLRGQQAGYGMWTAECGPKAECGRRSADVVWNQERGSFGGAVRPERGER
jgi:hypothetical protein